MTAPTTAAAILVLRNSTILTANVFVYTLEPTCMTARAIRCIGDLVGIRHKGRGIGRMTAFTGSLTRSVVTRVLGPIE